MIVPHDTMQRIVRARHMRIDEAARERRTVKFCSRLTQDGGLDACVVCGAPNAPHCTNNIKVHIALCEQCYDEQAAFWELDVLVNG